MSTLFALAWACWPCALMLGNLGNSYAVVHHIQDGGSRATQLFAANNIVIPYHYASGGKGSLQIESGCGTIILGGLYALGSATAAILRGDSGGPVLVPVNGEPVLLGTYYTTSRLPMAASWLAEIGAAMNALAAAAGDQTSYAPATVSLAGFTAF